jgi:hypothetical protein
MDQDQKNPIERIATALEQIAKSLRGINGRLGRLESCVRLDDRGKPKFTITGGVDTWEQNPR